MDTETTAIITGGGSGIGQAICLLFASRGVFVYILDLNLDAALQTLSRINGDGGQGFALRCDVTRQQEVVDLIGATPRIDMLVNCAGISHIGSADSTSESDFDRIYQVNVKGVYNCLFAALPRMKQQRSGVITNLSSVAATVGLEERFAYSMTKGAVSAMTLSVAKDYLPYNIRCNSISPGRVHTPFVDGFLAKNYPGREAGMFEKLSKTQPIGRMGRPEEVASLAWFLSSDDASFITGTDYPIDGGFIKLNT